MQTPNKRRLYTEQEDIMLLRQVNAERPFEAKKGEFMKVWGLVAKALADHEGFARPQFDAKKAQNRFSAVMDNHVHYNRESAMASGVAETYDERIALLDELLAAFVDAKEQTPRQRRDKSGSDDDDGEKASSSGSRFTKITTAMQEESKAERGLRQSELEFRKFQLEVERRKDRELVAEQARLHHETILAMLGALTKRQ
ncbi:hypothetical protein H257_14759 [Aphanomyces astaci]|uniref:Myb-like domain-containing protein n=1 Tax=Aphanomyces astaci TaxID=112090 RepID=W4FSB4_APHAT|nr:hypothetical protein H257_14759 [Aphanomyces astaci]ETV69523.1 hypothetical protein H257_14759 [Aphanomyces astaci]|eukprot:XP_009840947.1 hypothetical protein H257_14759 [Aphanomyces astaci]